MEPEISTEPVKKVLLAGVPKGTIVRVEGDWGVVVNREVVDLWHHGRIIFPPRTVVDVPARQKP